MTGRELIIYILKNSLEDQEIFKDGKLTGFMTVGEAAAKFDVGEATIEAWFRIGMIKGIILGKEIYIYADAKDPRKTFWGFS